MATTSSFFTGSDHNRNNQQQDLHTPTRPRRKSSKSSENNKKKTPRRGMGVEKLERLINNNKNSTSSVPYAFIPTAFAADPFGNGTMSFSKYDGMGAVGHGGCGGGSLSLMSSMVDMTAAGGRSFCPNGQGVKEVSKELPSIPNLMQCDYCADCFKKKRHVRYPCNKMVFDGVNPSFLDTPQGPKVVALHRTKASSTMGQENQVVMEYDFFSETKKSAGKSKTHDELMMMKKLNGRSGSSEQVSATAMSMVIQGGGSGSGGAGVGVGVGEASCLTTTTATANDASTYIDLSLKLSY